MSTSAPALCIAATKAATPFSKASVVFADMDNDGDNDLLIGNMGLNSNWQASPKQPMSLYVKDFDNNGDKEPIITYWRQGVEWCYNSKDELTSQMPFLKKQANELAA